MHQQGLIKNSKGNRKFLASSLIATVMLSISSPSVHAAQNACAFDLMGTSGPFYALMKDYALAAQKWGVDLKLKAYTDERVVSEDFKSGKCDLIAVPGMRGREFNKFVGSLNAFGGLVTKRDTYHAMRYMANPKLARKMVSGNYEVGGVLPMGTAFVLVNDRNINTLSKAAGKRFAVIDHDKSQAKMVERIGAQPVSSDITTFGTKFNNGQVDIMAAPAVAFKPLELHRGLGKKGGVIKYPIMQITGNVIFRKNKFPSDYGQKSRNWIVRQLPRLFRQIQKDERSIPKRYWVDIKKEDRLEYTRMLRDARIELARMGLYDKSMMRFLKKIRCKNKPNSFECALKGE